MPSNATVTRHLDCKLKSHRINQFSNPKTEGLDKQARHYDRSSLFPLSHVTLLATMSHTAIS